MSAKTVEMLNSSVTRRGVWIPRIGNGDVLTVREDQLGELASGSIRVKTAFAGLNFAELSARQGLYPDAPKLPCIVGYEGSGDIIAVGSEVTNFRVGDRVLYMTRFWGHADHVDVPAQYAVTLPESMSYEEGAALPVNYLTAYQMAYETARLRPGDKVLIHMAAGGVGIAMLQLCKAIGQVETFGTASASKHAAIKAQGCDHPIDYHTEDYVQAVRSIAKDGIDFVFDALGGDDWAKGYSLLREGGQLVMFGLANSNKGGGGRKLFHVAKQLWNVPKFKTMDLLNTNRGVSGTNMGTMWHRNDVMQRAFTKLLALHEQGLVKPVIDSVHSFDNAKEAFARLEFGKNVGKVLLRP